MTAARKDHGDADVLVLFGATGDLAKKKLFPALYNMAANNALNVDVVGYACGRLAQIRLGNEERAKCIPCGFQNVEHLSVPTVEL